MNALDSMSQIINAGLLANKGKAVDSVDIQIMTRTFNQQTYSAAFPKMQTWLNNISQSDEFKYIEAINNRTKHTADIANKLSMGILGSSNKTEIGPFFRKDVQHEKMELSDQLQATLDFLNKTWSDFLVLFEEEYVRDVYIENRRHSISGVRQQKLKEEPDQDLSYAYILTEKDFDSMPDEIYILLVSDREESVYAHEYTHSIKGTNAKAKANAAQGISELIEIAVGKHFRENNEEKHWRNAKFGWYRYDSRFALPVYDEEGEIERYNVFHASLIVRYSEDKKLYLYDILDIKKETSNPIEP